MSSVYKYNFNNIRLVMTSTLSKVTTGESLPSETLIAWTDPAFPAFVEAPTIHPINMVTEVRFHILLVEYWILFWPLFYNDWQKTQSRFCPHNPPHQHGHRGSVSYLRSKPTSDINLQKDCPETIIIDRGSQNWKTREARWPCCVSRWAPLFPPSHSISTVSLFAVRWQLLRELLLNQNQEYLSQVTRHMVTMVHNVTTDMGHVSCYADNGYGTPMQASRRITISSRTIWSTESECDYVGVWDSNKQVSVYVHSISTGPPLTLSRARWKATQRMEWGGNIPSSRMLDKPLSYSPPPQARSSV